MAETSSTEGNFLKLLKGRIEAEGMFAALNDEKLTSIVEIEVPAWISEFTQYIGAAVAPVLDEPDDFNQAQSSLAELQRQLNRLTYCYVTMLPIYRRLQHSRDMVSSYIMLEVTEVKQLKSAEMRTAATNYILSEFNDFLAQLDELYDIIEHVKLHVNKATFNLKMQMDLLEGKKNLYRGSSRVLGGSNN